MDNNDIVEIDLLKLLKSLWQNVLVIILVASLLAAAAFAYTYFLVTPIYSASVVFYVNNSSFSIGSSSFSISNAELTTSRSLVDTYILVLNSRTTLEQVIEQAGLDTTTDKLTKMISTKEISDTAAFEVIVESDSPTEAEQIANTIAEVLPQRISDIVYGSSVKIIDYAIVPSSPDSLNYTRNTIIGAFAGAFLSAAVIAVLMIIKENSAGEIESAEDLRRLYPDIPVFAVIPDMRHVNSKTYSYSYYGASKQNKNEAKQA